VLKPARRSRLINATYREACLHVYHVQLRAEENCGNELVNSVKHKRKPAPAETAYKSRKLHARLVRSVIEIRTCPIAGLSPVRITTES